MSHPQQPTPRPAAPRVPAPGSPVPPAPVDGLAVASLVTGVLGLGVVALVLGVLGLERTRRTGAGGRELAVVGTVLGGVVTLVGTLAAAVLVVVTVGAGLGVAAAGPWTASGGADEVQGSGDLRTGDCFTEGEDLAGPRVEVVPCARPHDGEVVSEHPTAQTGSAHPGDAVLEDEGDAVCDPEVLDRLADAGVPADDVAPGFFYPSAQTWADGDRTTLCLVEATDPDVHLTGSLRERTLVVQPSDGGGA